MQKNRFKLGPASLITAAFIGPGTVTVCTLAGVEFGFDLLWALVISILATIFIQNTAARLSFETELGLVSIIKAKLSNPALRFLGLALVVSAVFVGNIAYEAGNISGAMLGLDEFIAPGSIPLGRISLNTNPLIIGLLVSVMIWFGNIEFFKKLLITIVVLMSIAFIFAAIATQPSIPDLLRGLFIPKLDAEKTVRILSLVGTTVVPYNLFLHAALVKDSKKQGVSLRQLQQDTYLSIAIGGLISICIVIAAASLSGQAISNARDMGLALEPVLGTYAKYLISLGLFAAGLSSAITAPLAAAFVLGESLSWKNDKGSRSFKLTAIGVLVVGFIFASIGYKPVEIIQFAQVANGLLLPVIGVFIFWIVNAPNDLNISKPSLIENVLLLILMLFLFFLGMKSLGFIN